MNIAAFLGSPRINGNSELLLTQAIKAVEEEGHKVSLFRPSQMKLSHCTSCAGCNKTGKCVINDDMVEIYSALRESDRFIIASPVYFFSLPAQLKTIIDRCQAIWAEKYILKKQINEGPYGRKGLFILVSAMKNKKILASCKPVVSAFFNTINVSEFETLFYKGVDEKGEIKKLPSSLKEAYEAGKKLVKVKTFKQ